MRKIDAMTRSALAAAGLLAALGCQSASRGWSVAPDSEWREGGPRAAEALPPPGAASSPGLETIYFDYDAWSLGQDSRRALEKNARAIAANPQWGRLTVEGHCDERGSEEYNLLLGKRRAEEVAGYLADLGVSASRLSVVSFGEELPAVKGYSEEAYRWNRRSVFRVDRHASR